MKNNFKLVLSFALLGLMFLGNFNSAKATVINGGVCTYKSEVTSWSSCSASMRYATAVSFATTASSSPACVDAATVQACSKDIDGNDFGIINIGTQTWMADNLKTKRYNDGVDISRDGGVVGYGGSDANIYIYGGLYTYWVTNVPALCPTGWRMPIENDWAILKNSAGGDAGTWNGSGFVFTTAGGKLKTVARGGTNNFAFSALGGGKLDSDYGWNYGALGNSYWWVGNSAYTDGTNNARSMNDELNSTSFWVQYPRSKDARMSVRCIKEVPNSGILLTATTSSSCGGNIDFSWNKIDGVTGYNLYKNNLTSFWGSASNDIFSLTLNKYLPGNGTNAWPVTSTDLFTIKSYVYSGGIYTYSTSSNSISATPSAPCEQLSTSCSATSTSLIAPANITWTATSTSGVSTTTYSWSGTDGLLGTGLSITKNYTATGTKQAFVTVAFGNATTTVSCPGTVIGVIGTTTTGGCVTDCGVTIVEPTENGSCVMGGAYMTAPTNPYLCLTGTATPNPVTWNSGNNTWSWSCLGSGPNHTDANGCTASKLNPLDSSLTCTLSTASSTVNVNTNTLWTASSTVSRPQWTKTRWSTGSVTTTEPGKTFNNIFTTIGLKTVTAEIASTTEGVFGPPCTATTTVVQTGGGINEI